MVFTCQIIMYRFSFICRGPCMWYLLVRLSCIGLVLSVEAHVCGILLGSLLVLALFIDI